MRSDNRKIGLVIGKFLPFHKGHELLIKTACRFCEEVHVIIGVRADDPWTYDQRAGWILTATRNIGARVKCIEVNDDEIPEPTYDENGTAQEQWFWDHWIKKINSAYPFEGVRKRSHLFSSDLYGERLARELDLIWCPVDPDRELFEISGTELRQDWLHRHESWKFLPECVREDLAFKVAVVGPESTGKTIMSNKLAVDLTNLGANSVQEYGRTLSVLRKHELTVDDFHMIIQTQDLMIREMAKTYPVVITDTESIITELFADVYLESDHGVQADQRQLTPIDFYVLLAPTVEWVDDGERVISDQDERYAFYNKIKSRLIDEDKEFIEIDNSDFTERSSIARRAIYQKLEERNQSFKKALDY